MDDDQPRLKISDAGKRQLSLMVETYKSKLGNPDWFVFTDHVVAASKVETTKDILYRTCMGNYIKSPDPVALGALSRLDDFTFVDSDIHPDLDAIFDVLLGLTDAYGNPIPQERLTDSLHNSQHSV